MTLRTFLRRGSVKRALIVSGAVTFAIAGLLAAIVYVVSKYVLHTGAVWPGTVTCFVLALPFTFANVLSLWRSR